MNARSVIAGFVLAAMLVACHVDPRAPAVAGDAVAGKAALQVHDCGVCHHIPGVRGAVGQVGPPLDAFGKRIYIAGRFANDEAMLTKWIMDAPALASNTAMPALGVEAADARDMAAYLLSLR